MKCIKSIFVLSFCMTLLSLPLGVNAQEINTQEDSNAFGEENTEIIDLHDPDVLEYIKIRDKFLSHFYSMRLDKLEKKWKRIEKAKDRGELLEILELTEKEVELYRQQNETIKINLTKKYPELQFENLDLIGFIDYMNDLTSPVEYDNNEKDLIDIADKACRTLCWTAYGTCMLLCSGAPGPLCKAVCADVLVECSKKCPSGDGNQKRNIVESVKGYNYETLDVNIFPNPITNILKLNAKVPESNLITIQIYDILGTKVHEFSSYTLKGIYQRELQFPNHIPNGMYNINVRVGKYVANQKIMIVK